MGRTKTIVFLHHNLEAPNNERSMYNGGPGAASNLSSWTAAAAGFRAGRHRPAPGGRPTPGGRPNKGLAGRDRGEDGYLGALDDGIRCNGQQDESVARAWCTIRLSPGLELAA